MLPILLASAVLAIPPVIVDTVVVATAPVADTVVDLSRGDRVVLENVDGEVRLTTWNRDELEVRTTDDSRAALSVRRSGSSLQLRPDDSKGRRRGVEVEIRLPSWVDIEISGRSLDVRVNGVGGMLSITTVRGDVWVENTTGNVSVRSVQGEIVIVDASGTISASSQGDDVRLRRVSGSVQVHSGAGDLTLTDMEAHSVRAETQDGDITFSGSLMSGGDYAFFVHDGDATISIPEGTGARVKASVFDGEFTSDFPVLVDRYTGGREFEFAIGDAGARLDISVFDGEIQLRRQGR